MVTIETFRKIKTLYIEENETFPPCDSFSRFALKQTMYDIIGKETIPSELFKTCFSFSLACYDENGKGYHGIKYEIAKRLQFARDTGVNELPLSDFFKHTAKEYDIYDEENDTGTEIKTGCGNWLYSNFSELDKIREEKEKSNERINWHYHYTKKNDKEFSFTIVIETDWKHFFRYLDEYEKGYASFFKYNKAQSVKSSCTVYEMNTLKTSKKKVRFLRNFYEID